jgi:putative transposase
MQIKGFPKGFYKLYGYARKQECLEAYREKYTAIVDKWDALKSAGTDEKKIPEFVGYSRATYYRAKKALSNLALGKIPPSKRPKHVNKPKWGEKEKQLVLQVRRQNRTYGKFKITIILKRDFDCPISESTVGRILAHLKQKGLITKSASAAKKRKSRNFSNTHARAWTYKDYTTMKLGERVQIDHMSVCKNGVRVKHFQAWERLSRHLHAHAYSRATSRSAKRFLEELIRIAPYPILSIQVDGGSEFMADFEKCCEEHNIELIVLPPAKPTYNGGVERGNKTFREEFYDSATLQADSVGAIQNELSKAVDKYNTYRPHFSLDGLTPMEYITNCNLEAVA